MQLQYIRTQQCKTKKNASGRPRTRAPAAACYSLCKTLWGGFVSQMPREKLLSRQNLFFWTLCFLVFVPTRYGDQTLAAGEHLLSSRVLTVAPCACCVNFHVCMYKVSILGVFQYFLSLYHSVSSFSSHPFLISN
jgi:hypothetical protein